MTNNETKKSEDMPQVARQSERTRKAPVRYGYDEYADTSTHRVHHVAYHLCEVDEPTTLQEAMSSEHAAEWKVAKDSEYNSLIVNKTWKLVVLPPGRVAVQNDLLIHQMDVETAFLNGKLDEEIYMKKFGQTEAKSVSTPADLNVKLQKEDGVSRLVDAILYQSIVGSLLYAAIATRPDIAPAVGVVTKFCASPTQGHLTAAKRILRYLKGTTYLGFSYKKCAEGNLTGYSDADWAGDMDDRHSTSGNVFFLARGAVSCLSKKQATVALSTAQAEYVALSAATQEVIWLRRLLTNVRVPPGGPIVIHEDNQGAIAMTKNPVGHARTKHIDIHYHFLREGVQNGVIILKYIATDEMIADMLTKPLPKHRFEKLVTELGMKTVK